LTFSQISVIINIERGEKKNKNNPSNKIETPSFHYPRVAGGNGLYILGENGYSSMENKCD